MMRFENHRVRQNARTLNRVFKFPNISRPAVLAQRQLRVGTELRLTPAQIPPNLRCEMTRKQQYVVTTIAKWWYLYRKHRPPEKQIATTLAVLQRGLLVLVGAANYV